MMFFFFDTAYVNLIVHSHKEVIYTKYYHCLKLPHNCVSCSQILSYLVTWSLCGYITMFITVYVYYHNYWYSCCQDYAFVIRWSGTRINGYCVLMTTACYSTIICCVITWCKVVWCVDTAVSTDDVQSYVKVEVSCMCKLQPIKCCTWPLHQSFYLTPDQEKLAVSNTLWIF